MSESYHAPIRPRKPCKHKPPLTGIYAIRHVLSGKVYIGSSICVGCRWRYHKWDLNRDTHRNDYLQKAWNKYGESAFSFHILEECSFDMLVEREQYWIDATQCADDQFGFNLAPTAQSQRGVKHSEEFCQKLRQRKTSEHTKELLRKANLGKKRPPEDCEKISRNNAKRRLTREQVIEIQERYEACNHLIRQIDLAKEYGVSNHTISLVVRRAHPRYQTDIPMSNESRTKMMGMASTSIEKRRKWIEANTQKGENHPRARLTTEQVRSIRLEHIQGTTKTILAQKYNVTFMAIHSIVTYKSWSHTDADLRERK